MSTTCKTLGMILTTLFFLTCLAGCKNMKVQPRIGHSLTAEVEADSSTQGVDAPLK